MPIPIDPRKKPAAVQIHVSTGEGLDIKWADGHVSHYEFEYLREWCPCALCDEERLKKAKVVEKSGEAPKPAAPNPLQMFKPKLTARAAKAMGQYALQFDFTDGHVTGIYSFDYLRTICPCAECEKTFRTFGVDPSKRNKPIRQPKSPTFKEAKHGTRRVFLAPPVVPQRIPPHEDAGAASRSYRVFRNHC